MPDTHPDNAPARRRRGLFGLARRSAASWSERASNEASSALALAPGVAEEEAGRQRAPEPEGRSAEPNAVPAADSASAEPPIEQPSWREIDAPCCPR